MEEASAPFMPVSERPIQDEVLKNLSSPAIKEPVGVPKDILKNLTTPHSEEIKIPPIPTDVLKNLTAPR